MATFTTQVVGSDSEGDSYGIVDPHRFHEAIESAKNEGKQEDIDKGTFGTEKSRWWGAFVHTYSVNEYKGMTPFLFDEGRAGFALKNRDIVSVFKHRKCTLSTALDVLIPKAIKCSGNRLDCFNGALPSLYAKFGFSPVSKVQFSVEYAPEHWNYKRDNHPDIIYMVYKKEVVDRSRELPENRIQRIDAIISQLKYSTYEVALSIQENSCML